MASLYHIFEMARSWHDRVAVEARWPTAGSVLAGHDRATSPHQLSHTAYSALEATVDHLAALERLVRHPEAIDRRPPFTLVRPLIEYPAAAVWLMAPASRNERVLRLLRYRWADMRAGEDVRVMMGVPAPRPSMCGDRSSKISRRRGLTEQQVSQVASNPVGYETIVATAGAEAMTQGPHPGQGEAGLEGL